MNDTILLSVTSKRRAHVDCCLQVRQGLKTYSDWPTYPQLYADGELLGGCDIILELASRGELKDAIPSTACKVWHWPRYSMGPL